jgi:hypothetical protein
MNSTTNELATQLLQSLGGNIEDIKNKYLSTTNDILDACKNLLENGGIGGNSSNIQIPIPQIHLGKSGLKPHKKNENIEKWTNLKSRKIASEFPPISLYWSGSNSEFLNHDPHYFLFKYVNQGQGQQAPSRVGYLGRKNSIRNNKTFVHPGTFDNRPEPSNEVILNDLGQEIRPYIKLKPMFKNFGGGQTEVDYGFLTNKIKQTEWTVAGNAFNLTPLTNFHSSHYYKLHNKGQIEIFPISDFADNSANVLNSMLSLSKVQRRIGGGLTDKPRHHLNLVFKFAIVIRNPQDPTKYILGGFSDALVIKPTKGLFSILATEIGEDGTPRTIEKLNQLYWYKLSAMIK